MINLMKTLKQKAHIVKLTFYGYSNGRYYHEHFTSSDLEKLLVALATAKGAESVVATVFDGSREKSFCHFNDLHLRCGEEAHTDENLKKLQKCFSEVVRNQKTGWRKVSAFSKEDYLRRGYREATFGGKND